MVMKTLILLTTLLFGATLPFGYEHSGIDFDQNGYMYTHPDSGNSTHLYRFSPNLEGEWLWMNFPNVDWEDISIGECLNLDSSECIYLADTGQNYRRHSPVIYEIDASDTNNFYSHWINFEGGNGDVEAIAISEGSLYAIKKDGQSTLYKLDGNLFRVCGRFPLTGYVTGMDMQGSKMTLVYHKGRDYFINEYTMYECQVLSHRQLDFHSTRQVEGVAYRGSTIVAVAEDGTLFEIEEPLEQ